MEISSEFLHFSDNKMALRFIFTPLLHILLSGNILYAQTAESEKIKRYRDEIIIKILELAEKLNVRFAFPTQTLPMETFPDKSSLTPV